MDNWLNLNELEQQEDILDEFPRPPGLEVPAMRELIKAVTSPAPGTHPKQEIVRILQDNPPLLEYFVKQRQKERGVSNFDLDNPNVDRSWQQSVSAEKRRHIVELIAYMVKAYPAPEPHQIWSAERVILEASSFSTAGSSQDYFRVLAAEVQRVADDLEAKHQWYNSGLALMPVP